MDATPRHRQWFRFSLRTLLILVTALCCWLAWQLSIVRERQAVLRELKATTSFHFTTARDWEARYPAGAAKPAAATLSLSRRLLGDEAIQEVWYTTFTEGFSKDDLARVTKAFPEAQITESLPEPCHPGCFPRGTLVHTPQGLRAIESVTAGDLVTIILAGGEAQSAGVQSVFVTENRLWQIETEEGLLITTETQPLCRPDGSNVPAGKLKPDDLILRCVDGQVRSVRVTSVSPTDRYETVYNLIFGGSEVFVANGFLARSKPPAKDTQLLSQLAD